MPDIPSPSAPPFLAYLKCNEPLPSALYPALEQYLAELSHSIANLSVTDSLLEHKSADEPSMITVQIQRASLLEAYQLHAATRSAVRRLPSELLALIFRQALGSKPFDKTERCIFCSLRMVCRTWNNVAMTTPGLCPGLVLFLEHPSSSATPISVAKQELAVAFRPWFELPGTEDSFELIIDTVSHPPRDSLELFEVVVASYFSKVGSLTIRNPLLVTMLLLHFPEARPQIHHLSLGPRGQTVEINPGVYTGLEAIFPSLQCLSVESYSQLASPPNHSHLRSFLFQGDITSCKALEIHLCLSQLPRLQTLLLSCTHSTPREIQEPLPENATVLVHRNLKTLMLVGEQLLERFSYVTLPSLEQLHITGWGMKMAHDVHRASTRLQNLIERSNLQHLDVRIDGVVSISFLSSIISILSIPSRLRLGFFAIRHGMGVFYVDKGSEWEGPRVAVPINGLEEIACNQNAASLTWLGGGSHRLSPVDLYVPTTLLGEHKLTSGELADWGFNLQVLPNHKIDAMFFREDRIERHMRLG